MLVVFDLTREQSFVDIKDWVDEVREHASSTVSLLLVGNKCDAQDQYLS